MSRVGFTFTLIIVAVTLATVIGFTHSAMTHIQNCNLNGADFGQVYRIVLKGC